MAKDPFPVLRTWYLSPEGVVMTSASAFFFFALGAGVAVAEVSAVVGVAATEAGSCALAPGPVARPSKARMAGIKTVVRYFIFGSPRMNGEAAQVYPMPPWISARRRGRGAGRSGAPAPPTSAPGTGPFALETTASGNTWISTTNTPSAGTPRPGNGGSGFKIHVTYPPLRVI